MFRSLKIKFLSLAFVLVLALSSIGNLSAQEPTRRWDFPARDIHGRSITLATFINRVTVVSFSTQKSEESDMSLGQEIGQKFGQRRAYQSLAIPNTIDVPLWAKFVAVLKVKGAENEAVHEAWLRQKASGNNDITEAEVRRRVIFIHDKDGSVWERMGVDARSDRSFIGVIDKTGALVHLESMPIDKKTFFNVLEEEFDKGATAE